MNFADFIVLLIIAILIAGVAKIMKKQKQRGGGCHSGCAGCSRASTCSEKMYDPDDRPLSK